MALGQIPYSRMVWYAQLHGLEGQAVDDFCDLLTEIDASWLKKQQKSDPAPTSPGRSRTRRK